MWEDLSFIESIVWSPSERLQRKRISHLNQRTSSKKAPVLHLTKCRPQGEIIKGLSMGHDSREAPREDVDSARELESGRPSSFERSGEENRSLLSSFLALPIAQHLSPSTVPSSRASTAPNASVDFPDYSKPSVINPLSNATIQFPRSPILYTCQALSCWPHQVLPIAGWWDGAILPGYRVPVAGLDCKHSPMAPSSSRSSAT